MFKGIADKAKALRDKIEFPDAVLSTTRAVSEHLADKTRSMRDSIERNDALSNARTAVSEGIASGKSQANEMLTQYWPKIEYLIVNGLLTVAEEKLKDDEFVSAVVEKAYETLPTPVRLVLPRTLVIEYGMKQRQPMLVRLREIRETRSSDSYGEYQSDVPGPEGILGP